MSGNEILLNLGNAEHFSNGELISALIELGKRDKKQEHDWNVHPTAQKAVGLIYKRLSNLNAKNVLQTSLLLDSLRITDQNIW